MKKFLIIFFAFLIVGCAKPSKSEINTIVEEENTMIGINYPTTGYKKLDQAISSYVDSVYKNFKKDYPSITINEKPELNIDYTKDIVDGYTNITIHTFINASTLAHPITSLKTFVYKDKILTLKDFISIETLKKIVPIIKQQLLTNYKDCILLEEMHNKIIPDFEKYSLFTITNNNLIIYFNPYEVSAGYCGIIKIEIPLEKVGISIKQETPVVVEQKPIKINNQSVDIDKKVVALTFDDGPSNYTDSIITYFKEQNVVGTFFMLGNKVTAYKDTVRKVLEYGNEIGNHSYNHKLLSKLEPDDFKEQVNKTQDLIKKITGYSPTLLRPTYGSVNNKIRENTDLQIVLWNVDTLDWKTKNPEKLAKKALHDIKDGSIVLMHDTKSQTYKALKIIIPALKEQGYQFVTVSQFKEIQLLRKYQEDETRRN